MRISRLTLLTLVGALFLSSTLALHDNIHDIVTNNAFENKKRDLIGSLLPPVNKQPAQSPPASAPAPAPASAPVPSPAPAPAPPARNPGSPSTTSDVTKTGITAPPLPSLISEVLDPSPVGNPTGSASATTTAAPMNPGMNPKKKPATGTSGSSANGVNNSDDNAGLNNNAVSVDPANKSQDETSSSGLAPGLIAVMIILVLAILAAVMFSCYKIRQTRRRRRESWGEDILKNHAGSVGYSEGTGYGMYVGGEGYGKAKPDLWRKDLDLFHRG
ncbi:hypothetical protein BGX26_008895 [Mortierella sp. AD094]|nr:hypothetical protein BGX26_008895 [Mortierella sp. AD094]